MQNEKFVFKPFLSNETFWDELLLNHSKILLFSNQLCLFILKKTNIFAYLNLKLNFKSVK